MRRGLWIALRVVASLAAGVWGGLSMAFLQPRRLPAVHASPLFDAVGLANVGLNFAFCSRWPARPPFTSLRDLPRAIGARVDGDHGAHCTFQWRPARPITHLWNMPNANAMQPRQEATVYTDVRGSVRRVNRLVIGLTLEQAVASADTILRLGRAMPGARPLECRVPTRPERFDPYGRVEQLLRPQLRPIGWWTPRYQAIVTVRRMPARSDSTFMLSVEATAARWDGCPRTSPRVVRWWE